MAQRERVVRQVRVQMGERQKAAAEEQPRTGKRLDAMIDWVDVLNCSTVCRLSCDAVTLLHCSAVI